MNVENKISLFLPSFLPSCLPSYSRIFLIYIYIYILERLWFLLDKTYIMLTETIANHLLKNNLFIHVLQFSFKGISGNGISTL